MKELKRILLIEDSANDAELILAALSENHLANEVVVVRDGEEALDYLYRRGLFRLRMEGYPVVVLLDLKLPKVDGLEVLAQLKSDPVMRVIPVVVLTSSREEPDLVRCYELGVNAYVVKPVDYHDFVDSIKGVGLFWAVINQPPVGALPPAPHAQKESQ
ncbi:response regulator [Nostoc sp. 'Lobaria pulmonaria (5183) cyanobiont']|uniref:response regulator n=1 Tax=Nostoc sp. 'Lobaria pulmonaria (5183) cyanobiont' TaxID=1618022 RepID=UPI000CF354E5|nr:response regulator [Nostoc sp. 'Lobaria pulmonaria (5183) cyanobiont']AVH72795.1 response regulator receiver protein [Nostoc sp. 'Lobaria pulmonaria (5183) cyanobiont']